MHWDRSSNVLRHLARRVVTPQLMGRAVRRLLLRFRRGNGLTITSIVALMAASPTSGLAQVPVGLSLSATYARAYGAGGVGPDMGVIVELPGQLLSAHPSLGVTVAGAHVAVVRPRDAFVDADGRQLMIIAGRARLEWAVTGRLRLHGAGVLGVVESEVRSGLVPAADDIRPANHVGTTRGLAVGFESGAGIVLFPGALLEVAVAGIHQRAYVEDPVFMPLVRLGLRLLPGS